VKTISAMEMRKHMGEYLDEVRLKSEVIILERAGKPVAKLVPVNEGTCNASQKRSKVNKKMQTLNELKGLSSAKPRSDDIDQWLKDERSGWDK
jgi:prevent-host-death family protein